MSLHELFQWVWSAFPVVLIAVFAMWHRRDYERALFEIRALRARIAQLESELLPLAPSPASFEADAVEPLPPPPPPPASLPVARAVPRRAR